MRIFLFFVVLGVAMAPVPSGAQIAWQFQQQETPSRPLGSYLGVKLSDVDAERARIIKLGDSRGVEVKSVEENSPADNAGIQPGDVLVSYNGENIVGTQQLIRLVQETPAGRKIRVQLWRGGKVRATLVTTAPPPAPEPIGMLPNVPDVPVAILAWRNMMAGIEFEELDSQLGDCFGVPGGVLIRAVEKGSPADKSGLKAGDVIISVRHKAVLTAHDFTSCLRRPGAPASLGLVRNHKKLDLVLSLPGNGQ